jgi:RNA polymerase sigma-70 factor (ECF subfamily)
MSTPVRRLEASPFTQPSAPGNDECAWIAGIVAGDEAPFEAMFRAYHRELYRFALRLLGSADDAEDAVQGVFVAIWQSRSGWTVRGSLRIYLFSAVRNRALQQLRNARTRQRHVGDVLEFSSALLSHPLGDPDRQLEHAEFSAALTAAIAALPPRCREAFVLTREHGMTYAEAAATMGISPHTVMVQIGRALTSLRTALAPFLLALVTLR